MSDFMNNFQKTGFWNFGKIIDTKSCLELQKNKNINNYYFIFTK